MTQRSQHTEVTFESIVTVISPPEEETSKQDNCTDYEVQAVHEIGELLFLASIGNVPRLEQTLKENSLRIDDERTCDYDKRTALHIAADSGNYAAAEWLLKQGAPVNAVDRFNQTPLASAVRSRQPELIKLLQKYGGLVLNEGEELVPLKESPMIDILLPYFGSGITDDWEISVDRVQRLKVIGHGQHGEVYLAKWNGAMCVSKTIKETDLSNPTVLAEFRSEISLQHRLHHPNVLQFFGVVMKPPIQIIVEYMDGGTLKDAFAGAYSFGPKRATKVALEIAKGLVYLHEREPRPIIHRDLKPGNLLLKSSGEVKIADFGLSRALKKQAAFEKYTLTGETGTYRYMPPEVFKHESYDTSVDIYAFALVVYQCYTWEVPFSPLEGLEACKRASIGQRPSIESPNIPPDVGLILKTCWEQDASKRLRALEVMRKLESIYEAMDKNSKGDSCCNIS